MLHFLILTTWHFGNGKTTKTTEDERVPGVWGEGERAARQNVDLSAVKLFRMTLYGKMLLSNTRAGQGRTRLNTEEAVGQDRYENLAPLLDFP